MNETVTRMDSHINTYTMSETGCDRDKRDGAEQEKQITRMEQLLRPNALQATISSFFSVYFCFSAFILLFNNTPHLSNSTYLYGDAMHSIAYLLACTEKLTEIEEITQQ